MNLIQKAALWTAGKAYAMAESLGVFSVADPQLTQKLTGDQYFGGSQAGRNVNESSAMRVTTFFACVRLLAETMGAMPSAVYRNEKNGNATKVDDHPLAEILIHQPNTDMNGIEFREASTTNIVTRGNVYCFLERRANGEAYSIYPVPTSRCQTRRNAETGLIEHGINDRGKMDWYPPDKVWHRKSFSFDGLVGLSPIGYAREALALALAGEEFNTKLFEQGLMPSARVSMPQWLTKEQREIANAKLLEMHAGMRNMGKPMLLEGGMKVESGLMTSEDAQFLQLRQFTVIEICRMLGVKPHMVAALERATDNNIEKLSLEFVTYTMLPHLRRDEAAARKLFKLSERNTHFYRYNFEGLLRADSAARAALYSILLQNGVFNRNEVRALENRNRVNEDAMDDYTVQLNLTMIDQLAAAVAAKQPQRAAAEPTKAGDVHVTVSPPSTVFEKEAISVRPVSHTHMPWSPDAADLQDLTEKVQAQALANEQESERLRLLRESLRTAPPKHEELKEVLERDADGRIKRVRTVTTEILDE